MVGFGAASSTSGVSSASQTSSPFRNDRLCLTRWLVKRCVCTGPSSGATVMIGFASGDGFACLLSLIGIVDVLEGFGCLVASSFMALRRSLPAGQWRHWQGMLSRFGDSNQAACGANSGTLRYCLGPPVNLLKPRYGFWVRYSPQR